MVALSNGQTIIFSSCGFFFFFPRLISAVADWMSAILPQMMWPYCKFKMQVWNVLHAARSKYRTKELILVSICIICYHLLYVDST